jgi:hypothetical protein
MAAQRVKDIDAAGEYRGRASDIAEFPRKA